MQEQDELNDAERKFERALRSLRPAPARIDAMAAALAAGRRSARRRVRLWQTAAAAAIVAAGGAWLALGPHGSELVRVERPLPALAPRSVVAVAQPVEPPTLLAYRRALAKSPAALDALLNAHATTRVASDAEVTPVSVLNYWNSNLRSSLGAM